MPLRAVGSITIPASDGTVFDHGAFEPQTRRVFVAHTARHRLEVIDHGLPPFGQPRWLRRGCRRRC
jgi:hypothetical protein